MLFFYKIQKQTEIWRIFFFFDFSLIFFFSYLNVCWSLYLEEYWVTADIDDIHVQSIMNPISIYLFCNYVFFEDSEWLILPVLHKNEMFPENPILKLHVFFFLMAIYFMFIQRIKPNALPNIWLSLKLDFRDKIWTHPVNSWYILIETGLFIKLKT